MTRASVSASRGVFSRARATTCRVVEPDDLLLLGGPGAAPRCRPCPPLLRHARTWRGGSGSAGRRPVVQPHAGVLLRELPGLAPAADFVGVSDHEGLRALVHPDGRDSETAVIKRLARFFGAVAVAELHPLCGQLIATTCAGQCCGRRIAHLRLCNAGSARAVPQAAGANGSAGSGSPSRRIAESSSALHDPNVESGGADRACKRVSSPGPGGPDQPGTAAAR